MPEALYMQNDNLLQITGLQDAATGSYINDATVTVTLKDSADVEVTGQSWPTTLGYVASSNGDYQATLSDQLALIDKADYVAEITADGGSGLKGFWTLRVRARERAVV